MLVAVGVLAIIGGFAIRLILGGSGIRGGAGVPGVPGGAAVASTGTSPAPAGRATGNSGVSVPAGPSATGSSSAATPPVDGTPVPSHPSSSARPAIALTGAGDHDAVPVTLAGGRYEVSYTVSSDAGESCPWALYLTGSNGLDLLMASAYPVDETLRAAESDSFIAGGQATVRVVSGCPRWSATVTRTGP